MTAYRLVGAVALLIGQSPPAAAQSPAPPPAPTPCAEDPAFRVLDFWVGSWDVYVGDTLDGHDRVTQILAGCAVTEEWTDADGSKGMSLQ